MVKDSDELRSLIRETGIDKRNIDSCSDDLNQSVPLPPGSASVDSLGNLKDTPANRALRPGTTSDETFRAESLRKKAFMFTDKALLFHGDSSKILRLLAKQDMQVDCIITSPPFYGQRDYGSEGQIGLESHPRQFIRSLVKIFNLCRPILRDTGSLWVNLGDTYWSGKGAHKSGEIKQKARRFGVRPQDLPGDGAWTRPKQLLLIPHRFSVAMQDAGWLVRNDNIWIKPNPIPDQVRDRSSISHEHVFHFTKSRWYYYNRELVGRRTANGRTLPPLDTWSVPPSTGNGIHKASFSEELLEIPVLATTPRFGIVLDPFVGSGTSMIFANRLGFRSIGIDLNETYCLQTADAIRKLSGYELDSNLVDGQ